LLWFNKNKNFRDDLLDLMSRDYRIAVQKQKVEKRVQFVRYIT